MKKSKIRASARGKSCTVRIQNVCNFNSETTIFAHLGGGGMGKKMPDLFGAYCCSSCHDVVDGRVKRGANSANDIRIDFLNGMVRTQLILLAKGLVKIE